MSPSRQDGIEPKYYADQEDAYAMRKILGPGLKKIEDEKAAKEAAEAAKASASSSSASGAKAAATKRTSSKRGRGGKRR